MSELFNALDDNNTDIAAPPENCLLTMLMLIIMII